MPLSLKSIGGGNVSLDAPATASNYTVNIPTTTGTLVAGDSATGALVLPSGATTDRPAVPYNGATRWNSTLNRIEVFSNFDWYDINSPIDPIYNINRSLRFRASASAYLVRTFSTPTNNLKWTWAGWVKRGSLGSYQRFFNCNTDTGNYFRFTNTDNLQFSFQSAYGFTTTQVFRDPSAWYHIQLAIDTTQATAANRILLYVNGVQITSFSSVTYPALNGASNFNTASVHNISGYSNATGELFDGYLTEVNFIDGQALSPFSFGRYNAVTGVWMPIAYTGTYGTNGFYLKFEDNSGATATTIGKDSSGNNNNWTPNNISVTAGVTYDSMTDVPTLTSATAANYATLNPVAKSANTTLSNGNLTYTGADLVPATLYATTGKYYFEAVYTGSLDATGAGIGVIAGNKTVPVSGWPGNVVNMWWVYSGNTSSASFITETSSVAANAAVLTSGTQLKLCIDIDAGKIWYGRDTVWYNSTGGTTGNPSTGDNPTLTISSPTTRGGFTFFVICYASGGTIQTNFGQRPFTYTPPTGFVALNTYNLP